MSKAFLPLGTTFIFGAWFSILLGAIMVGVAIGFEFITLNNTDQSLDASILNGAITLSVGYVLYLLIKRFIGNFSAVFTLETLPDIHIKIEEMMATNSITNDEASEKRTQLMNYVNIMGALDGMMVIIGWSYILIVMIFVVLSFVADYKLIDIDVGKFAIFETAALIGLYFIMIIYMFIINERAHKLVYNQS